MKIFVQDDSTTHSRIINVHVSFNSILEDDNNVKPSKRLRTPPGVDKEYGDEQQEIEDDKNVCFTKPHILLSLQVLMNQICRKCGHLFCSHHCCSRSI